MRASPTLRTISRNLLKTNLTRISFRPTTRTTLMSQSGVPSQTAKLQAQSNAMSSSTGPSDAASYEVQSTDIKTSTGVSLSGEQKVLVGSVLDLFKGLPSKRKMSLWADDATFADPLTQAQGRKQYEAQWWGLKAAFSEIEQLSHSVTSAGNPITMDLSTRYKTVGVEKVIDSVIKIHVDAAGQKIVKVEDRWNGEIPEGAIAKAFRNLNSVVVPAFVSVPKSEAEEKK